MCSKARKRLAGKALQRLGLAALVAVFAGIAAFPVQAQASFWSNEIVVSNDTDEELYLDKSATETTGFWGAFHTPPEKLDKGLTVIKSLAEFGAPGLTTKFTYRPNAQPSGCTRDRGLRVKMIAGVGVLLKDYDSALTGFVLGQDFSSMGSKALIVIANKRYC